MKSDPWWRISNGRSSRGAMMRFGNHNRISLRMSFYENISNDPIRSAPLHVYRRQRQQHSTQPLGCERMQRLWLLRPRQQRWVPRRERPKLQVLEEVVFFQRSGPPILDSMSPREDRQQLPPVVNATTKIEALSDEESGAHQVFHTGFR
jgi:hypothetical protein